jgi:hypothetical protein
MKYYTELDIDYFDVIVKKSLDFVKNKSEIYERRSNASWYDIKISELLEVVPEISLAFSKFNLTPVMAAIYVMYDRRHTAIHRDAYPSLARINIPLLNCAGTYTNFYKNDIVKEFINPQTRVKSYRNVNANIQLVDRIELKKATVLRTNEPHTVELPMKNPVPRITLTIGFNRDPVFLLEDTQN